MIFCFVKKGCALGVPALLPLVIAVLLTPAAARGGVVVVSNRTGQPVLTSVIVDKRQQQITLQPGQQTILRVTESCQLLYRVSDELVRYQLDANSVYFFALNEEGWLDLRQVDLGQRADSTGAAAHRSPPPATRELAEIPVKLLVDNHDPTPRQAWEKRLRKRVAQVSQILQQHCQLSLKVVACDTWDSGNEELNFTQALHNFRRQVDPHPGHIAIGFTGRYQSKQGRIHLGATQGMLQSHILIREWAPSMSEPERTEVLLHEIGHYLGAVHSPDSHSVMRPVLADNRAIHRSFKIGFDPVNTLIINLIADEIRSRQIDGVSSLSAGTRQELTRTYGALLKAIPRDKSIRQYLSQLNMADGTPLARATRSVVRAVRLGAQNQDAEKSTTGRLSSDQLTEFYVRRAALAAGKAPREIAAQAFLLGLGIALDNSDTLLRNPVTANFCRQVETEAERSARHRALGRPTLRGRRDLAQHFFLSAYLTAVVGASAAESAGFAKELADSRSHSGFSYRDLAADVAGVEFAQRLLDGKLSLSQLASPRRRVELMPNVADLPEGITWQEIGVQLRGQEQQGVQHYRTVIRRRVRGLVETADSPAPVAR
jgi:hypothetical protein